MKAIIVAILAAALSSCATPRATLRYSTTEPDGDMDYGEEAGLIRYNRLHSGGGGHRPSYSDLEFERDMLEIDTLNLQNEVENAQREAQEAQFNLEMVEAG